MSGTNTHEEMSFGDLLEQSFKQDEIRDGDIVDGRIVAVQRDQVIVDFGFKSEGAISASEFPRGEDGKPAVKEGDTISVFVESKRENQDGLCVLSKEKADRMRIWDDIAKAYDTDSTIEGTVVSRVKGGLQVDIGVKAFLPGSQVDLRPIRNLDKLLGEKFRFKVIKFNKRRNNIVLSRRLVLEQEREEKKSETLKKLQEGAILDGQVKNITEYGAFIDLGGIDGLLHITDMSWGRLNHPSDMFKVGDEVRVKVLKFDAATERVSLGLKQIQDDPWIEADKKYPVGARVSGRVVSLTDYGAFVELEPGIEGLVHITEMSWTKRVKHPSKLYAIGDEVTAMVLEIDISQKRISLGIKQTEPNPWQLLAKKYPLGTVIQGPIRNLADFGIFVGVEEGIDGLVHISDISWSGRLKHPGELYSEGIDVEAVVLDINVDQERFSLGIKQLTDDPWRAMPDRLEPGSHVQGRILKVDRSEAWVELEPGIEGLLPADEYSNQGPVDLTQVLTPGDVELMVVININPDQRIITVSRKRA
ncbi:MAG: 30S ribosomal protein S1 [Myxococcales bacterium]|nr:30S ribosomal protein S1 [Myxococcales bacterium]MCB9646102.1 30S ribosomal protein S1 [Deltaproteobacteria bacterium]